MSQEEAIRKIDGPCVILAGAGTGKTYTIVEKVKYLINNKIYNPERIVCITFSNEAANNLSGRILKSLNSERVPIIRTFHSFSADLLRKYGEKIGISRDFIILTPDDAKVVLFKYLRVPAGNCHQYISNIGIAKDLGIELEKIKKYLENKLKDYDGIDLERRLESLQFSLHTLYLGDKKFSRSEINNQIKKIADLVKLRKFINAWTAYEKLKTAKNYQDYSDLNMNALRLLQENKEISNEFDYIIVDEFQDTNKVQLDMLFSLAANGNISVVGDLNQSIYRFRGAYNRNFSEFRERFNVRGEDIFNLDKSFRSSNKILRNAYSLILNNYTDEKAGCFEVFNYNNREGQNIEVYEMRNQKEEVRKIAELVDNEIKNGCEFGDICVMFRTHQQGRLIRKIFEFNKIPYVSVSKNALTKERSVRTAIDYLVILNKLKNKEKGGEQAWWDLVFQLKFGKDDLIKIGKLIKENKDAENLAALMLESLPELQLSEEGKMNAFVLIKKIKMMLENSNKSVPELLQEIYKISGLIGDQKTREEKTIMMNLNKFYELAKDHSALHSPDLGSFIYYLEILENLGIDIQASDSEEKGVRLMTLHATKGLEYKTVIITNLAQKRFPMERISSSLIPLELYPEFEKNNLNEKDSYYFIHENERANQLFEERRLCYVAFTRAKEKLIITYAQEYGGKRFYPSQFLNEIKYKENMDLAFIIDLEEKYLEPEEAKPIQNFVSILEGNFANLEIYDKKKIFSISDLTLSPSSILLFRECQKKYEYKYVYNMPEQKSISWEALMLGSFVHLILERGVKANFKALKNFEDIAKEMHMDKEWEGVDLDEALLLIKVFFERNKKKYGSNSKTEQKLNTILGGVKFTGFADRIDFTNEGVEIIDYKTGRYSIAPLARNWQLGYYAIAASQLWKVKRITLDMLRHETPLEFHVDENGNAVPVNSSRMEGFNIYDVEQELVKGAHEIVSAYQKGFKSCPIESNCEFCNEYIWEL